MIGSRIVERRANLAEVAVGGDWELLGEPDIAIDWVIETGVRSCPD